MTICVGFSDSFETGFVLGGFLALGFVLVWLK